MENRSEIIILSNNFTNIKSLKNRTKEDKEINILSQRAFQYLERQTWCKEIETGWLAEGWGYMVGVFLFKIIPINTDVDDYVWIVVGDIPPAYIDIGAKSVPDVLDSYISIMKDWVDCAINNLPVDECFPISVPPTKEYAEMLNSRIHLIKKVILGLSK